MKKAVALFFMLDMWCLTGLAYKFYNSLYTLKDNKTTEYEYVDFKGNKGYSKHCYEQDSIFICQNGKSGLKVLKYSKKEMN